MTSALPGGRPSATGGRSPSDDEPLELRPRSGSPGPADPEDFLENAPIGLHLLDAGGRIVWANRAELDLLGYDDAEYIGHHAAEFHVDRAVAADLLDRLSRRGAVDEIEVRLRAKDGSIKVVALRAGREDAEGGHARCYLIDVSDRVRRDERRAEAARRSERLTAITAAIADAATVEQVIEAVVDQVAAALDAFTADLWLLDEDGITARRAHTAGYLRAPPPLDSAPIEPGGRLPVVDAIGTRRPLWIASQAELVARYPHLAAVVTPGRSYRVACLPLVTQGKALGALGLTFEGAAARGPAFTEGERALLVQLAGRAAAAIEASRLHRETELARHRAELLYRLARAVIEAQSVGDVFEAALASLEETVGATRASILVLDADGVMRFKAWRGLSERYRRAVEGHSPWPRDAQDPQPVLVPDVAEDEGLRAYLPLFRDEGIGALGFIPLVTAGRLLGKFMVYYQGPRRLSPHELHLATAVAHHVAAAIARFSAVEELQRTVRFNEMFTAILGHDLRNPLAGILSAAQLALKRSKGEAIARPLGRILTSGERMARMIDQLLDFTRVRLGAGIPIQPRPVDLLALLQQVLDELGDANPGVALHLARVGDTEGVWDEDRLCQIFSNLVGNALQHGTQESGVRVEVDGSASAAVRVDVHNAGAVPEEILASLFEPMTGGVRRRAHSRGLGLGLFITRQIALAHGGTIEVASTDGAGTTFTVSLPRIVPGREGASR